MKRKLFIIVALLLLVLASCYDIPGIPYYKLDIVDNGLAQGSNSLHIITISSEYDFDAVYYTLDNSSPSESSYWYSATALIGADLNTYYGIVISEGTTIKAIGYRGEQGSFISEITISSCSHKWDDGQITTKPTCMAKGEKTYTCTACGQIMKIPLAITDHAWDSGEIVTAPTCTTSGTKTYTCTACGETKTEIIEATGHSWNSGEMTTIPTCETEGVRTYTCSVCGQTRTEVVEVSHVWNSGEVTTAPTCANGVKTYTCTICGQTKTESIDPTDNHTWDSGEITTEPSCADGVKTYTCTVCGQTKTESIDAITAHSWNSGVVTKSATCKTTGVKTYTCAVCGQTRTETIGVTAVHTWNSGVVTKSATCKTTGVKTYTCTVCGQTKTAVIPTTAHSWNSGVVTEPATCTTTGVKTYTCTVCGQTKTATISATDHVWDSGEVTTAPTCKTSGVLTYTCTSCGQTNDVTLSEQSDAHSFVNYKCSLCGLWGKGPAGGYVFYDKGSYSNGWRYLEAAPTDLSSTYIFGYYRSSDTSNNLLVGTNTAIGTGRANTEALVKAMGKTAYSSESGTDKLIYAAKACADYSVNGYDDWFLPSKEELNLMYTNLSKNYYLGAFPGNTYWSSSEYSNTAAWWQNFGNGTQGCGYGSYKSYIGNIISYEYYRNFNLKIRPIRAF